MKALHELEQVAGHPAIYVFVALFGTLWGSFANVCIYRWPPSDEFPKGRSVVAPGSHCFVCKTPIKWYDNVPLLSYLWLRGRCRSCKTQFSARYLLVEAVTGALFAMAWWATVDAGALFEPFDARLLRFGIAAAFVFVMVVVTFIDLDHMLILDKVTYPSIVIFYGLGLLLPERVWWHGLLGAALGYGIVWLIAEVHYRLRGIEGMGLGDGKLLAVVGALLGWQGVVVSLFGGSIVGAVIGIGSLLVRGRGGDEPSEVVAEPAEAATDAEHATEADADLDDGLTGNELPFGPYLAMAAMFYLFAEPWVNIQLRLLGH